MILLEDKPEATTQKVIQISGTPEQAERAQSLLQGFILSSKALFCSIAHSHLLLQPNWHILTICVVLIWPESFDFYFIFCLTCNDMLLPSLLNFQLKKMVLEIILEMAIRSKTCCSWLSSEFLEEIVCQSDLPLVYAGPHIKVLGSFVPKFGP